MKTLLISIFLLLTARAFCQENTKADCDVMVPTAFTPNGDGENDVLIVRGTKVTDGIIEIYNRWGEMVYTSKDPTTGWDGTYKGAALNSDVFVYYLRATCPDKTKIERKGTVTLIR